MTQLEKSALRRTILQQRQSLSPAQWQLKSNLICDRLKSISLFQKAQTILAYFSFRQEPDLSPLFGLNKTWVFPRCLGKSLIWHSWQPGTELNTGKYGIQEPFETATMVEPATADLILVPTVACDAQGYRLGYGGGFYDRLLSCERNLSVLTIGIVFDFAYGVQLAKDPWDMKLNFICTETKFDSY
jgi:5-formyltetrahydrofolate cyclo-ligase